MCCRALVSLASRSMKASGLGHTARWTGEPARFVCQRGSPAGTWRRSVIWMSTRWPRHSRAHPKIFCKKRRPWQTVRLHNVPVPLYFLFRKFICSLTCHNEQAKASAECGWPSLAKQQRVASGTSLKMSDASVFVDFNLVEVHIVPVQIRAKNTNNFKKTKAGV